MVEKPRTRETKHIPLSRIVATVGARPLNQREVERIADSMSKVGLIAPITVNLSYKSENPDAITVPGQTKYHIIAGRHRLAAALRLGWETIECFIDFDADERQAELWEIAENLHRAELTALERDEQIARWVELTSDKPVQSEQVYGGRGNQGGLSAATRELGIDRADAWRAIKTASLTEEAKEAAREAGLDDNRTALLEAAKAEPARQASIIRDMAEKKSSGIDSELRKEAARNIASRLAERFPAAEWEWLKSQLYTAGAKGIADAFVNETGAGSSVMGAKWG
jgi:ParB family chromosome partitioning protein